MKQSPAEFHNLQMKKYTTGGENKVRGEQENNRTQSNVFLVKQAQGTLDIQALVLLNKRQKIHLANRTWHRYLFEVETLNCV